MSTTELINDLALVSVSDNLDAIVLLQTWFRMMIQKNRILIPKANYQTKIWRMRQRWYNNGKRNECEVYQKTKINLITNQNIGITHDRIKMDIVAIINIKYPLRYNDGYEYTENFDGLQIINGYKIYYNLKFVCDKGGAQTRTLRNVYEFIRYQQKILAVNANILFINILDGDSCFDAMDKFQYLISNKTYADIKKYIFIGNMYDFQIFWKTRLISIISDPANRRILSIPVQS